MALRVNVAIKAHKGKNDKKIGRAVFKYSTYARGCNNLLYKATMR